MELQILRLDFLCPIFLLIPIFLSNAKVMYFTEPKDFALLKCNSRTENFTDDSIYGISRKLFFTFRASVVAENRGFYNTTLGHGTETFYGQAFCRYDKSSQSCLDCLDKAIADITQRCPIEKNVTRLQYSCHIRYGSYPVYGLLEIRPPDLVYGSTGNLPSAINRAGFYQIWNNIMSELATTRASMGNFKATNKTDVSLLTIYALMQCTPGLTQQDCKQCLRTVAIDYKYCSGGNERGFATTLSCTFEWGFYPFYDAAVPFAPSPSPVPFPSTSSPLIDKTTKKDTGGIFKHYRVDVIVAVVCAIVIILAFSACIIYACFHSKKSKKGTERRLNREDLDENSNTRCTKYTFENIKNVTVDFSAKVGQGGFSDVYEGTLQNGQKVAVKRLKTSREGGDQFENEAKLLPRLQHRNLVRLLDFCFEGDEKLLIYEFAPKLSLDRYIFDDEEQHCKLDWNERQKILVGIANGLKYIHEDSPMRIIHSDIKLGNILLDEDMNPKISDFGIAEQVTDDIFETPQIRGTPCYMAPEYNIPRVSVKKDIYSFGILVLEIICGRRKRGSGDGEVCLLINHVRDENSWNNWEKIVLDKKDPNLNTDSSSQILKFIQIAFLCLQRDPEKRPTMGEVISILPVTSSSMLPVSSSPHEQIGATVSQSNQFVSTVDRRIKKEADTH